MSERKASVEFGHHDSQGQDDHLGKNILETPRSAAFKIDEGTLLRYTPFLWKYDGIKTSGIML
jgi:hypothetical protein